MKKKLLVGTLSVLLVLGGAIAVGATDDDSKSKTQTVPLNAEGKKVEIETEHGQTFYKVETDDDNKASTAQPVNNTAISVEEASKIATNTVNGTITEVEQEYEHGRLEYDFEIQSNRGEAEVSIDAETGKVTEVEFDDDDDRREDDDQDVDNDDN
ncbi:PepSY domain-containing protein [Neobacillus sp. FSL H8-0543]|uniref:PepSY domain-containing protein n=1 Tax=Neobacillus sp. FSL H8-0543 TaxID=2954672 RepID=UPI00315994B0